MPKSKRFKPELIRTVPVHYLKAGDTIMVDTQEIQVESIDKPKNMKHYNVRYKGRDHYYGERSKIARLENPI